MAYHIRRRFVKVVPDDENNAEEWWAALDDAAPGIARELRENNESVVISEVADILTELPGFRGGPEYAPDALRMEPAPGPGWEALG